MKPLTYGEVFDRLVEVGVRYRLIEWKQTPDWLLRERAVDAVCRRFPEFATIPAKDLVKS